MKTQKGTLIGYARVSTEEQNLSMQVAALKSAGVDPKLIFTEKKSGASSRLLQRAAAFRQCREGDTLVVWRTDRIGRDTLAVLEFLKKLDDAGVKFKSLTDPVDNTTAAGKAMMSMAVVFAEFERNTTRERIKAGMARAIADGVQVGKKSIFTPEVQAKIAVWIREDGLSAKQIAKRLGCHANSYRRVYTADIIAAIRANKPVVIDTKVRKKR